MSYLIPEWIQYRRKNDVIEDIIRSIDGFGIQQLNVLKLIQYVVI